MDMDLSLLVMPQPKIKVEEDSDIIDLDNDKTLEDLVYEWDARVCTKLKNYSIIETEEALDTLMKWYIQSLKDEAMSLEDFKNLKGLVKKHIQFFKLYFTQLNCCFGDNFLDNMEEIMSFYVDVELKSVLKKSKNVAKAYQKYLSSLCRKMVCMMNLYLMNNEEHIYHILMKIKVNLLSEESKDLVNLLYRTFLTNPKDKSDMAFCRGYILYQKWKIFRKPNEWEKMDEVMYKLYDQTPDSVRNNEILKPILLPQSNSILDSLTHITEKYVIICNEYFKYRKSMKVQEQSVILPELGDISLNDSIFPELIYDEEDREFNNAYNTFVQSMAALSKKRDNKVLDTSTAIEIDDDDDDDCQIIGISTLNHCSEELDLVHEVLDDDDGIEMIYFKKKEPQINPLEQKKTKSFLDMIDLSNHIEQPERPEKVSLIKTESPAQHSPSDNLVTTSSSISFLDAINISDNVDQPNSSEKISLKITNSPVQNTSTNNLITSSSISFLDSIDISNHVEQPERPEKALSINTNSPVHRLLTTNLVTTSNSTSSLNEDVSSIHPISGIGSLDVKANKQSITITANNTQQSELNSMELKEYEAKGDTFSSKDNSDLSVMAQPLQDLITTDDGSKKCSCKEKQVDYSRTENQGENCYCYGIITPPSDQPADDLAIRPVDTPNVYTNIVRTHNNELDSIAKMSDYDYSAASLVENSEGKSKCSNTICKMEECPSFRPSLEDGHNGKGEGQVGICDEERNLEYGMENEEDIESNARKKQNLPEKPNSTDSEKILTEKTTKVDGEEKVTNRIMLNENFESDSSNLVTVSNSAEHLVDLPLIASPRPENSIVCEPPDNGQSIAPQSNNIVSSPIQVSEPLNTGLLQSLQSSDRIGPPEFSSPKCSILPDASPSIPSTSTDVRQSISPTSANNNPSNLQSKPQDANHCASPDITSTSADFQDQDRDVSNEVESANRVVCQNLVLNEAGEYYLDGGDYCSEYVTYSKCIDANSVSNENVSPSNLEDGEGVEIFIEDNVLINNQEELSFMMDEVFPIGATVDIVMENTCSTSDMSSPKSNPDSIHSQPEKQKYDDNITVSPKDLKVAVEKIDVGSRKCKTEKNVGSYTKVMYSTSKREQTPIDDFAKFEETIQSRWSKLKERHNLNEMLAGPISKINGVNNCVNPDTNFDLFKSSEEPIPNTPSPINSVGDVTSPAFEGIDDFKSYYEENKNNNITSILDTPSPAQHKLLEKLANIEKSCLKNNTNKRTPQKFAKDLRTLQNSEVNTTVKSPSNLSVFDGIDAKVMSKAKPPTNGKRTRITFAEHKIDTRSFDSHSPLKNPPAVQSILKKRNVLKLRIPRHLMNLKSLAQYNVKPNDPCIQGVPCVVVEKLSDSEISQWLKVSEISRKFRLQKHQASSQSIFRVDYNKQTFHINENDVVHYNTPEAIVSLPQVLGQWRSNSVLQTKSSRLDEGMVTASPNSNDKYNISIQCKNICCSSLTSDLSNLNVSKVNPRVSLNGSPHCSKLKCYCPNSPQLNPFLLSSSSGAAKKTKKPDNFPKCIKSCHDYCDCSNLVTSTINSDITDDLNINFIPNLTDLTLNSKPVANISLDLNHSDFNKVGHLHQQPAIVPEVEEFEKTIKIDEMEKTSSISSDLYNLNLKKCSQSPIISSFSPRSNSSSQTSLSDICTIKNTPLFPESEDFNMYTDDADNFVKHADKKKLNCNAVLNVDFSRLFNEHIKEECSLFKFENDFKSVNIDNNNDSDLPIELNKNILSKERMFEMSDSKCTDVLSKIDVNLLEIGPETRLPLKKRKLSVANSKEEIIADDFLGPDLVEEIIKRARAEKIDKEDISYPAKPMISIAEIQEKLVEPQPRVFKTPAERKEMPPSPAQNYPNNLDSPRIVTEQYNNHTYNNPTINYHMNNVPYPFFPCASLPYFPSILLPINSTFDIVNQQAGQQPPAKQEDICRPRKKSQRSKK